MSHFACLGFFRPGRKTSERRKKPNQTESDNQYGLNRETNGDNGDDAAIETQGDDAEVPDRMEDTELRNWKELSKIVDRFFMICFVIIQIVTGALAFISLTKNRNFMPF